jgi:hypothetical protein
MTNSNMFLNRIIRITSLLDTFCFKTVLKYMLFALEFGPGGSNYPNYYFTTGRE